MKNWPAYLKWRSGRPRWEPGPGLRAAGFRGQDLKDKTGEWMTKGAAVDRATELNCEVEVWRASAVATAPARPAARRVHARSCESLFDNWTATPEYAMLAENTRRDYRSKARAFLDTVVDEASAETFGHTPVAAVSRKHLKNLWRELYTERGHTMASGVLRVVGIMMSHAVDEEWIKLSPARKLKLKAPPPRQVLWLPHELAHLVAAADELGLLSIGDAVVAALHSGQRQADVLELPERLFDETRIRLSQFKTKARIDAPMTPALLGRVAAIKARRAGESVVDLSRPLILRDDTGERYDRFFFGKRFRDVRARAAKNAGGDAGSAIAAKTFQDLRDTAVTRLALAGCTLPEIGAITGHSQASITAIIRHYLVLQPAMADAAIGKLSAWLEQQGIAI